MSQETRSIWRRIIEVDERVIFALVLIVSIVPLVRPLLLPVVITPMTRDVYNKIETLPAGSVVCIDSSHTAGVWAEIAGPCLSVWRHLFSRPLKIVFIAFVEDGALIQHQVISTMIDKGTKQYGVDWVQLGFVAGQETGVAAFAADIGKVITIDYYGRRLSELPLMQQVKNAKDMNLLIAGAGNVIWFIRQVNAPYKVPVIDMALASQAPGFMPYMQSGQLAGMILSVSGGAEYELLMRRPGLSLKTADALSLMAIFIIGLVVLGNISYWKMKKETKK